MRISDWSSDVCSSDLYRRHALQAGNGRFTRGVATAPGSITNQVPPSSDQRSRRGEKTMNNTMSPVLSFVGNSAGSASMNRPGASSTDSGSWYEAMSKAWGQTLDAQASQIHSLSDVIGSGGDQPSNMVKSE